MLATKTARTLLKDVNFPGDADPTYIIALAGKAKRREKLQSSNKQQKVAAALEIQRVWRGHRTRCKLHVILGKRQSVNTSFSADTASLLKSSSKSRHPKITLQYKEYLQWCHDQGLHEHSQAVLSFEDYSARIIQSWWRRLAPLWIRTSAVEPMTAGESVEMKVEQSKLKVWDEETAAVAIQRVWRRHNDMKVFKFYRDLINFRGKGNPALMLKCINPTEAKLLDKAAGAHVRFRLGGANFPPNIYYKVYTHRPIIDLCAYSPRDYTAMAVRKKQARDIHNKDPRAIQEDRENWYKRHENNGWRLVSDRIFLSPLQDPVTIETSSKTVDFHYSQLQREDTVKKRKKQRKIEWLRKMYRQGMLEARKGLSETTSSAVNVAAEQLVELTDSHGVEVVEERDVDELLGWTNGLNYDEYIKDWHLSASSDFSDNKHQVTLSEDDPFGLTLQQR